MKATIVTIGDEILIGQVLDTNSQFLATAFEQIGVQVQEMLSISDDKNHILDTFSRLQDNTDFVIITGGLGPTKDDITKTTLCEYFQDELISNPKVLQNVERLFSQFSDKPLLQTNIDQALVPSKAQLLHNEFGTAPGMWLVKSNTVFVSLPGVPYEMKAIVENTLLPKIAKEFQRPFIIHKTIMTYGQGESFVADRISDWEDSLPEFIKLAYLPAPGRLRLRLSARGKNKQLLEQTVAEKVVALGQIIGDIIVGYDDGQTLEVVLGKLLIENGKTISTAESCTGGKIAQLITSIPGSSQYFKGSIVSYAREVKTGILEVSEQTIEQHSVVSEAVAREMAQNVRRILKTDYSIAVTGNAGPTSDDTPEEVGIVFIAVAGPKGVVAERFNFGQPREKVIDRCVNKSLEMLQKEILKNV